MSRTPKCKIFCVSRHPLCGPPVRGRPHWLVHIPPPFDRTSLMDGPLKFYRNYTRLNKPKNITPTKTSFLLVLASVHWW